MDLIQGLIISVMLWIFFLLFSLRLSMNDYMYIWKLDINYCTYMSSRNLCLASSRESKSICDKDQHKVSVITTISEDTNLRLLMPYGTKS